MVEFKESKFYKLLQDFFINNNKETFLQMLAEFYNRTEGIINKNKNQDEIIKELYELYKEFNEKNIDENIVREKVNYFVENNGKIKDILTKLIINTNKIEDNTEKLNTNTNNIKNINSQLEYIETDLGNRAYKQYVDDNDAEILRQVAQGATDEQLKNAVQTKIDDGSIPSLMVGNDGIDTVNLRNNSVTTDKVNFNVQYELITTELYIKTVRNENKSIDLTLTGNGNIVFYIMRDNIVLQNNDFGVGTLNNNIPNWHTLVYDIDDRTLKNIYYNNKINKNQVPLLINSNGEITGGLLAIRERNKVNYINDIQFKINSMDILDYNITINSNSSLYLYERNSNKFKNISLDGSYLLEQWDKLILNLDTFTIDKVKSNEKVPQNYIILASRHSNGITGLLIDEYISIKECGYNEETFVYLSNPESLKIQNLVNGWTFINFSGDLIIRPYGITKSLLDLKNNFSRSATSWSGIKDCFYIQNGEILVYDRIINDFAIRYNASDGYIKTTDIVIAKKDIYGNFISEVFNLNSRINYQSRVESDKVPKYLEPTIKEKHNLLLSNQLKQDIESVNVALIADSHQSEFYGGMYSQGVNVINNYSKSFGLDAFVNLGDSILYDSDRKNAVIAHQYFANKSKIQMLYAVGNHDGNGRDNDPDTQPLSELISNRDLYHIYGKNLKGVVWGKKHDMYYYYDIPNSNVRIIVLNSNDVPFLADGSGNAKFNSNTNYAFRQAQLNWLANEALKTDKHIMICTHIVPVGHYEGMYYNYELPLNYLELRTILEAFKNKQRGNVTKNHSGTKFQNLGADTFDINVAYDFTLNTGSIIGVFGGHLHDDNNVIINGIHYITTNCDWARNWTPTNPVAGDVPDKGQIRVIPDRVVGEESELCFDILNIDTTNKKVCITRFGVGSNREYNY